MRTRNLASLMVMLSLAAAALLTAAADVNDEVILLPSDGGEGLAGDEVTMASAAAEAWVEKKKGSEEEAAAARKFDDVDARPWECCNQTLCTKSFPPTCHCLDVVDRCAGNCHKCEPAIFNPSHLVCNDEFHGDPGPTCAADDVPSGAYSRSSPSLAAAAQLLLAFVVLFVILSYY